MCIYAVTFQRIEARLANRSFSQQIQIHYHHGRRQRGQGGRDPPGFSYMVQI